MIVSGMCWSFKEELLRAIHAFQSDTIKAALYTAAADLRPDITTAYGATNEATGTNWPAGGVALAVSPTYPKIHTPTGRGVVAFESLTVPSVTVTFRAVLIYNASKANRAILILDRGADVVVTAGPLVLLNNPVSPFLIPIA